jgi:diacylglycerol kinase (ATP)
LSSYGFIFNPASNRSRSNHVLEEIHDFIAQHKLLANVHVLDPQERIADIAAHMAEHHDVVVACGGDGTILAAVSGLIGTDVRLAILPVGSGNDFVKTLGIPKKINKALHLLIEHQLRPIDVGKVNGETFVNTLGIGFDGETNRRTGECRWLKGSPMYIWAALKSNFTYQAEPYKILIDDRTLEQQYLMITVANGQVEGGHFVIAPQADPSDGLLDIITLDPISPLILPFHLLRFMNGSHQRLKQVQSYQSKSLVIEHPSSKAVPMHLDGEQIALEFPLRIQVINHATTVLVPSS